MAAALVAAALLLGGVFAFRQPDDDVPVDPTRPDAIAAIAAAKAIVPGELIDVSRDTNDGDKWEVTLRANGDHYEVELERRTLELLRIDYK